VIYTLTPKAKKPSSKYNLPMCRYRSNTKYCGPRLVLTTDWRTAKVFKSREDAVFYLSNLYDKYGKQIFDWKAVRIDKLIRAQKRNPIKQLHTGLVLNKWPKREFKSE
jgi:hypothetical protein